MDPRSNPVHGQGPSQSDDPFTTFWSNLEQGSLKLADFSGNQELSVLLTCSSALPGTSSGLDFARPPQTESLASSFDDIGIFVEPVDSVDPQTDAIAATPSTTSASTHSFPYTPAETLPDAGQLILGHDFSYHNGLTDSASTPSPGTSLPKEPFTSRLAKRSMSFTRSSSQRGRLPFRRDSRPPDIDLPPGSARRDLSPLDIFPQQSSSTGPHTEPNLNETSFDWSEPPNPALLSPPCSSTLESRRKRSGSIRSQRAASVSGQPGSAFLSVPDHSNKSGPTRRRSTSVPSEPTSNFCSINISDVTRPRAYSHSQPRSPAASLTTSPSGSSFEDLQDSNGSGSLPPFQLPPSHELYNPYDIPSYEPSPEFPLLELDSLNFYTHRNSSASSITSQHSLHSQASLSPQLYPPEAADFLRTSGSGFDINADYLHSMPALGHISDDGLYHDNNGGGPSISVTNTDNGSAQPQVGDDFFLPNFLAILGDGNDSTLSGGGLASPFTDPAAALPADTLHYPAASPEQPFNHFDSPDPTTLDYGNLPMPSSAFPVHTFSDGQNSNKAQSFAGSQGETRSVNYTLTGGQHISGTHPRISATAMHEMHGNPNNRSTIGEPLKQGVRPRTLGGTSNFHMLGSATGLGTYPHCDKNISTAERSSHSAHHLGNISHHVVGVGTPAAPEHVGIGTLHENQGFHRFNSGFSDRTAPSPSTYDSTASAEASSSSSVRKYSRASCDNSLDPQFEAKKLVYKILTESSSKDKAFEKVNERARGMKSNLIRSVFDDASQRKVKSTPAGQQRAQDRRSRPPTFICILCQSQFTTNNNLQNHYRSHLRMDQYRCPRCGDYFRTEGIRKRHTESAQKCRRLDGP